ncbi:MAG: hypothetical protein IJF83_10920 [Methanobrevibacter sp.]|nr:hypothetical protein [Methanobrevibacter sp.]
MREFEFDLNKYMEHLLMKYTEQIRENEKLRIYNQQLLTENKHVKGQGNE